MLITDGAMEDFQDVFEEFNWPERRVWHAHLQTLVKCTASKQTHVRDCVLYQAVYGDCRLSQLTHAHFTLSSLQVRVFTYLIGREMTFADNVKWIACNNKGKKNNKTKPNLGINHSSEGQRICFVTETLLVWSLVFPHNLKCGSLQDKD